MKSSRPFSRAALLLPFALLAPATLPAQVTEDLKAVAEASLAASLRRAHPHETNRAVPGAPKPSPSQPPGNAFTQGIPGDDAEQTAVYSIPCITGENGGYDIFNAVNPGDAQPGKGLVTAFYSGVNGRRRDAPGDRYLLGDAEKPYYLGRTGALDRDFARILDLDPRPGSVIQLHGTPADYAMVQTAGVEPGTAIFYRRGGVNDLVGFIDGESFLSPQASIYRYVEGANRPAATPVLLRLGDQWGGANADLITAVALDAAGNAYVTGVSRSEDQTVFAADTGRGMLFAASYAADGRRRWFTRFGAADPLGAQTWAITADGTHVYVAGRYIAAESVPFGLKDAAYFKLEAASGRLVKEELWNDQGVQYAGGVALDNADFVYTSGIGIDPTQRNPDGSQDPYLEKRRRADLSLVKRVLFGGDEAGKPGAGGGTNKEPWGGLTFVPKTGGAPGEGTIYSAGWSQGAYEGTTVVGGGDVWLAAFDQDLRLLWVEGWGSTERDWSWDLAVDGDGFIYVTGLTLGTMTGATPNRGAADAFITKLDPRAAQGRRVVWTRQLGSDKSDELRKISVVGNRIYAAGHTYGSIAAPNVGESDAWVVQLDLDGNVLKQFQSGTPEDDRANLAADATKIVVAGYTFGSLSTTSAGYIDAFTLALDPVTLTPLPWPALPAGSSQIANLSMRARGEPGANALINGLVIGGTEPKRVLLRAVGPALGALGVPGVQADPVLELRSATGAVLATNDNWGAADAAAMLQAGAFPFTAGSKDAALVTTLAPGQYTVVASGAAGGAGGVALVETYDLTPERGRLVNLSARARVGVGSDVLIAGVVVRGEGTKRLLIRGVGPALGKFGVEGFLADPVLNLNSDRGATLATNDNWSAADAAAMRAAGAFAFDVGSKDAAFVVVLSAGAYTVSIAGRNATEGVALVELFELP